MRIIAGVQTGALPIWPTVQVVRGDGVHHPIGADFLGAVDADVDAEGHPRLADHHGLDLEVLAATREQAEQARRHHGGDDRPEERSVGKEGVSTCRCRRTSTYYKTTE